MAIASHHCCALTNNSSFFAFLIKRACILSGEFAQHCSIVSCGKQGLEYSGLPTTALCHDLSMDLRSLLFCSERLNTQFRI